MAGYHHAFSIGSEDTEGGHSYNECPHQDRDRLEKKIMFRKRAVILALVTIFTVTAIMLVTSVVIEERRVHTVYQEIVCQETDKECTMLLCPQGWQWNKMKEECQIMQGQ